MTIPTGAVVTCEFANLTGQTIRFLDFRFDYAGIDGEIPSPGAFFTEDGTGEGDAIGWSFRPINQFSAQFIGGGIPPQDCFGEIEG